MQTLKSAAVVFVPDLSPTSMGTLEDAIQAELDARSSGQEAKEGNLSG